jgi:hypothetical protein
MAAVRTRIADEHGRAEAAGRQRKSSHPIQQELQLSRLVGVGPPHEKKIQRSFKGGPRRERRSM